MIFCFEIMKRKFKQWCSTIPPISTKWTSTHHLNSLNLKKTTTYDIGNPGPRLGHAQKCGWVKPAYWILVQDVYLFDYSVFWLWWRLCLKPAMCTKLDIYFFSRVAKKSNSAYNMMNVVRASTFSFLHNILRMKCLI